MRPNSPLVEKYALSKVVQTGELGRLLDIGVTADWFQDRTHRQIFKRMLSLKQEHGSVTLRMLNLDFPNYTFVEVPEDWSWILEQLREGYTYAILDRGFADIVDLFTKDKSTAEDLRNELSLLYSEAEQAAPQTTDTNLAENQQERLDRYDEWAEKRDQMLGIPMGFEFIDKATRGFQPGHLITFIGEAKSGKTSLSILAANAAFAKHYKVLFVSFEMTEEEISARLDAFKAKVSLKGLTHGTLSRPERAELQRSVHEFDHDFIIVNDTSSAMTLTGLASKIDDYKPDLLVVDGTYMMQDENGELPGSPRALTNITRGLKRLADNKNIPIIQTTQVLGHKVDRKRGLTADAIGYSSSFAQDSTLIIGVERDPDEPDVRLLKVVLARHIPPGLQKRVRWDFDHGDFEELDDLPEDDEDATASY